MAKLKRISAECEYGEALNEMLRDRLVCGVNNRCSQRGSLAEPNLTFKKAIDLKQAMRAASKTYRHQQDEACMPHIDLQKSASTVEKRNHIERWPS